MCLYLALMGLYLLNEFNLESQSENFVRHVLSQVTYCKEKTQNLLCCKK